MLLAHLPDLSKTVVDWLTIIFAVLGVGATVGAAVWVYLITKRDNSKKLSYFTSETKILSSGHPFGSEIQIFHCGTPITDASVVRATVINHGGMPIEAANFASKLVVTFPNSGQILSVQLESSKPPDLRPNMTNTSPQPVVFVDPLLLNPGDEFTLAVLVSNFAGKVSVEARISGVKEVVYRTASDDIDKYVELAQSMVGPLASIPFVASSLSLGVSLLKIIQTRQVKAKNQIDQT